jgi:hypothetical protein
MSVWLWVGVVLLGWLLAFTVCAFLEGELGGLSGARVRRCPRCGRHGLVANGRPHARGCPHPWYLQRMRHLRDARSVAVRFGHR